MEFVNGNVKKTLLLFALPLMVSLMAEQLYNIVDTVIVGRFLGIDELSAVGNAGSIIQILVVIAGGMEMGCEIVFAKFSGKWKDEKCKQSIVSVLIFCIICALLLSVIGMLGKETIVAYMNIPKHIIPNLYAYYHIYVCCIVFTYVYAVARAILLAMGNSRVCMFLVIMTSGLNIILDLIFICILRLGVSGAALATVMAQCLGMIVTLIILVKKTELIKCSRIKKDIFVQKMKEVLSIAVPSIFQQFAITLSSLLLMSIVNPFGTSIISGYIAVEKIMMFTLIPVVALSMSISMFASANEHNLERIKEGFFFLNKVAFIYITVLVIIIVIAPKLLVSPFIDVDKNIQTFNFAKEYLSFSIIAFYFASMKFMNEGLLRGFSKMKLFLLSNLSDLFVKVGFAYLFVSLLNEQVFWMAGMSGRIIAVIISTFILYRLQIIKGISKTKNKI